MRSRWSFIPGRDGDVEEGGIRGEPDAEDAGDGEVYEMPTANGSGSGNKFPESAVQSQILTAFSSSDPRPTT